jgi:uncharacterized membrane protein
MSKAQTLLQGIGVGAALMYLFDPERGRFRRTQLRDQAGHHLRALDKTLDRTARDLSNRAYGGLAEVRAWLRDERVTDAVLEARVRAKLGRCVSHPHAIHVAADQGWVTLSGPVLKCEVEGLLAGVSAVRGVVRVENWLDVHAQAEGVPALQGGKSRPAAQSDWMQADPSPTARLLGGAAGGALMLYGTRRRDALGAALNTVGLGLLLRSLTHPKPASLFWPEDRRNTLELHSNLIVQAPIERVFGFWTAFENLPRFLSPVRKVQDRGYGHLHWSVADTNGVALEWEATVTRFLPKRELAWLSVPGSIIENFGRVRFHPEPGGGTRLDIQMIFGPSRRAAEEDITRLFGPDAKHRWEANLRQMKALIESENAPTEAVVPVPVL